MNKKNNNAAAILKLAIAPSVFRGKTLTAGDFGKFAGFGVCRAGGKMLAKEYLARVSAMGAGMTEAVHALNGGKCSAALRCVLAIAAHDAQAMISASAAAHIAATAAERAATDEANEEARAASTEERAALRKLISACECYCAATDGAVIPDGAKAEDCARLAREIVTAAGIDWEAPDVLVKAACAPLAPLAHDIILALSVYAERVAAATEKRNAAARARNAEEAACLKYYATESDLIEAVKAAQEFARANPDDGKAAEALKAARADLEAFRAMNAE